MALKIRLRRMGAKKQPSYRVVVAEARSPRDGRFVESIGHYNPLTNPKTVVIDQERTKFWLAKGARPTDTVAKLLKWAGYAPAEAGVASAESAATEAEPAEGGEAQGE